MEYDTKNQEPSSEDPIETTLQDHPLSHQPMENNTKNQESLP